MCTNQLGATNSWALNQSTFNKVVKKIRKKRKKVNILFTKAGDSYKQALCEYNKKGN